MGVSEVVSLRYDQLVVIQGCDVSSIKDKMWFKDFLKKNKFRQPKIVGVVETLPSLDENNIELPGTGKRKDFFFYVNNKDLHRFSFWRFQYGILFWEDIVNSKENDVYPVEWLKKLKLN